MTDLFSFAEPSTLCTRTSWGSRVKLVFLHKTLVYEHPSCSRIQEHGCGDRCEGGEGGVLNLDIEGVRGVL